MIMQNLLNKRILVLNGSINELPIIEKLKEMGAYVITTGNDKSLIGHKSANEYIPCDYSNKEGILKLVIDNSIDGVITCANDFGVITSSYVCEKMNWNWQDSYNNSILMHHKDLFKKYCLDNNIPSPYSCEFTSIEDAKLYCSNTMYPIMVKANDLTGGKGIRKVNNYEEACYALENAFRLSKDKHILIEEYIGGTQHTISTFIINKKIIASTSCNCYSPINPYLIQSETFPGKDINLYKEQLHGIIEKMCEKLNLKDGIFAFQFKVYNGKIYIFEMMRRIFGNQFHVLCSLTTGFDFVEGHIRAQLGMNMDDLVNNIKKPEMLYCGHHGIMAKKNATVIGYYIPNEIKKHIFKIIDMCDDEIIIKDFMKERIAYIYYKYDSYEEMTKQVLEFNNKIIINYKN